MAGVQVGKLQPCADSDFPAATRRIKLGIFPADERHCFYLAITKECCCAEVLADFICPFLVNGSIQGRSLSASAGPGMATMKKKLPSALAIFPSPWKQDSGFTSRNSVSAQ